MGCMRWAIPAATRVGVSMSAWVRSGWGGLAAAAAATFVLGAGVALGVVQLVGWPASAPPAVPGLPAAAPRIMPITPSPPPANAQALTPPARPAPSPTARPSAAAANAARLPRATGTPLQPASAIDELDSNGDTAAPQHGHGSEDGHGGRHHTGD